MYFVIIFMFLLFLSSGYTSPVVRGQKLDSTKDCCSKNKKVQKITNIFKKSTESLPYMVQLELSCIQDEEEYLVTCGAFIYSEEILLTSGHCMTIPNCEIFFIKAGVGFTNIEESLDIGQFQKVKAYKIHEGYISGEVIRKGKRYYQINDITILWLKHPFLLKKKVHKASLPKSFTSLKGKIGYAFGWGTNENGEESLILEKAELKVIDNTECTKRLNDTITDGAFCAISKDKINKCGASTGDSGGPFVIDKIVYGIISYGVTINVTTPDKEIVQICNPNFPQVFTNIFYYLPWISKTLKAGPPTNSCQENRRACAFDT